MGRSVLVVGDGGREHTLGWRLAASPSVDRVVSAPGNPGLAELGPVHALAADDPRQVAELAERERIDLVVVGPEAPLVAGVVDELHARGIAAFGPTAAGARIEGSKAFAKQVMHAAGVPTGEAVATGAREEAYAALERFGAPYVVKADGLAAGKGVTVAEDLAQARRAVDAALVDRVFGEAGAQVVIEEFLAGPERSVFAVCDGADAVLLAPAQDYKRAHDGDTGPNTGGMGAYSPVAGFDLDDIGHLRERIFAPVLAELAARGTPYRGLLYAGLVDTAAGPRLLEFNARFGDPETQAILPRLAGDLGELLWAAATGSVADAQVGWHPDAAVTVVLASGGYPGSYRTGRVISGVAAARAEPDVEVFHAGTALDPDGSLVTDGGRVLAVTASGADLDTARTRAYAAADRIHFDGVQRRDDIARTPSGDRAHLDG